MNDVQLEKTLRSVGKLCYMTCYERAVTKGENLDRQDIIDCNPGIVLRYAPSSIKTKRSGIKLEDFQAQQAKTSFTNMQAKPSWKSRKGCC